MAGLSRTGSIWGLGSGMNPFSSNKSPIKKELKKVVSNFIKNFPLSMDNLVKAAATAKEYCHFEGVSATLYANCVDFTKAQFTDVDSLLTFVQENDDDVMVMKLLKDIKLPVEEICSNCKQKPCRNKSNILATDLITLQLLTRTLQL